MPERHSIEQSVARQSGFLAAVVQVLAWQQSAGTQSASVAQAAGAPGCADALAPGASTTEGEGEGGEGSGEGRSPVLAVQAANSMHARVESALCMRMA